jgi:hypothetical protein
LNFTAFIRVLPHISLDEFFWRLLFFIFSMAHTMSHSMTPNIVRVLRHLGSRTANIHSFDLGDPANADRVLSYLVKFAAAGLKAEYGKGGTTKSEEVNQL